MRSLNFCRIQYHLSVSLTSYSLICVCKIQPQHSQVLFYVEWPHLCPPKLQYLQNPSLKIFLWTPCSKTIANWFLFCDSTSFGIPTPQPVVCCPSTRSPVGSSRAWEETLASSKTPYMVLTCAVPAFISEDFFEWCSVSTLELVGCLLSALLAHFFLPSPVPQCYWREKRGV